MFISRRPCRCIIGDCRQACKQTFTDKTLIHQNIQCISKIFLASTALSREYFPVSSDFLEPVDPKMSYFLERIFTSGIIQWKIRNNRRENLPILRQRIFLSSRHFLLVIKPYCRFLYFAPWYT